nr:hypothetical protein [Tanacetum cinerariifolium]
DATFDGNEHSTEHPESTVNLSLGSSAQSGEQDDINKKRNKGKSPIDYFTGNRDFNEDFEDYSEDISNDVSTAGHIVPTAGQNYFNNTNSISAAGHTQEEGIDYEEVFASVARIEAIRLFLAYASFMGFMVYQMDVKSVFLYGTIEEEVAWYETLATYILENGFHGGQIDQTLFIKKQKGEILLVQIYVDDIIFGVTNKDLSKSFEELMKDKFQMSLMRELTFFLGLQVKQKEDGIFINQDKYVAEILKKFGLTKGKSASTPIDTEKPLLKDPDGE